MLVQLSGSAVFGVDAHLITIEVNVDKGIGYHLVGFLTMPLKKAIIALPQHYRILATNFQEKKLPLTWLQPIYGKKARLTIYL